MELVRSWGWSRGICEVDPKALAMAGVWEVCSHQGEVGAEEC
jgi:hypothetical protein